MSTSPPPPERGGAMHTEPARAEPARLEPSLTSNHVNYLIWRYLQERGYGRTAIQLSRDWGTSDPQALPFASEIRPHTLVSVLQDGLSYDALLASVGGSKPGSRSSGPEANGFDATAAAAAAAMAMGPGMRWRRYTFLGERKHLFTDDTGELGHDGLVNGTRKRPRLDALGPGAGRANNNTGMGPLLQRRRKSAVATATAKDLSVDVKGDDDGMDVDEVMGEPDEPDAEHESEEEIVQEEIIPLKTTLEIGQDAGVQSEAPVDERIVTRSASLTFPGGDIVDSVWDTRHPSQVRAIGGSVFSTLDIGAVEGSTDASADVDADSAAMSIDVQESLTRLPHKTQVFVSALAQSPGGSAEALTFDQSMSPTSMLFVRRDALSGTPAEAALELSGTALLLRLEPRTEKLLVCTHDAAGEMACAVYEMAAGEGRGDITLVCSARMSHTPLDAAWLAQDKFAIASEACISVYELPSAEAPEKNGSGTTAPPRGVQLKHTTSPGHAWESLAFDDATQQLACAANETGYVGLLKLEGYSLVTKPAHDDQISGLRWQPLVALQKEDSAMEIDSNHNTNKRLLATSCIDGSCKIWNAKPALECLYVLSMDEMTPALALAFAPTGSFVAVAGGGSVKVWSIDPSAEDLPQERNVDEDDKSLVAHWKYDATVSQAVEDEGDMQSIDQPGTQALPQIPQDDASVPKDRVNGERVENGAPTNSVASIAAVSGGTAPSREDGGESSYHVLAWNAAGTHIAYSHGEQMHILDVRRQCRADVPVGSDNPTAGEEPVNGESAVAPENDVNDVDAEAAADS